MFHLVKLVFLLSMLSGTANAQWGTVVAQNDTNRFITSQYKYGLVMPHQNVIVGNLDTTITSVGIGGGNAYKVIVGSLLDYEDNCVNYSIVNSVASCVGSYELWREMEKSTSYYQAGRGDTTKMFPTNYAITSATGKDSVKIWNRDTAELWMAFVGSSNGIVQDNGAGGVGPQVFKDGIVYIATENGDGVKIIDFLLDGAKNYNTNGLGQWKGNLQQRNSELGFVVVSSTPALASGASEVNAIAVVRDPFGLKDDLGRPAHWWIVSSPSNGGGSLYNPHTNTILDQGATSGDSNNLSVSDTGQIWLSWNDSGSYDYFAMVGLVGNNTIFGQTADGWTPQINYGGGAAKGKEKLAWTSGDNGIKVFASNNHQSIVGENADNGYIWCDEGAYIIHPSGGFGVGAKQDVFAKQRFSSTVNAPVEFGDAVLTMALEDNTTDSSPYGNTMTAHNSPGTVAAVFGNGYSSTNNSYLSSLGQAEYAPGTGDWAVALWFKADATNRGAQQLFEINNGSTQRIYGHFEPDGSLYFNAIATTSDIINPTADIEDGQWHHVVFTQDGANVVLYLDGVNAGSDAVGHSTLSGIDDVYVGAYTGGAANIFIGLIDDFTYAVGSSISEEAAAKLHAEGRKKLSMGTPVFTRTTDDALLSNNVVDIDALDNGMWAVAFSDANTVQVFDGRIPVQEIAAPAGTVKSIALIQSPGADSVGVAIGTTTNLKFVQPSVNLRAAMAHQYKEPIHVGTPVVVDSAGIGGIFWTGDDAIDAGANANHRRIFVMDGTYGSLNLDQSRMYVECESTEAIFNGKVANHGIYVTAPRSVIDGCGAMTTAGGGSAYSGIHVAATGDSTKIIGAHIIDSDNLAIDWVPSANYGWILDNTIDGADATCIQPDALQIIVQGNQIRSCGSRGIAVDAGGDIQILGNHVRGTAGSAITIRDGSNSDNNIMLGNFTSGGSHGINIAGSGATNNIAVGNRLSGATTANYNNVGTSTTATGNNAN